MADLNAPQAGAPTIAGNEPPQAGAAAPASITDLIQVIAPMAQAAGKENDKPGTNGKKSQGNEEWRTKAPPDADKFKAKFLKNEKTPFYWCEHFKKWVRHKPHECDHKKKGTDAESVHLQKALAALDAGSYSDEE